MAAFKLNVYSTFSADSQVTYQRLYLNPISYLAIAKLPQSQSNKANNPLVLCLHVVVMFFFPLIYWVFKIDW